MKKHIIDITEKLKSVRSSWRMHLIIGTFFEYVESDKNC